MHSSASVDSKNCRLYSSLVLNIEKNLPTSGPTQFKPVLFQDSVSIISQLKETG